jgi:hypothetical protein
MAMRGGCCPLDGGKEAMRGGGITLDDSPDAGRLYDKQTKCAASEAPPSSPSRNFCAEIRDRELEGSNRRLALILKVLGIIVVGGCEWIASGKNQGEGIVQRQCLQKGSSKVCRDSVAT